MALPEFDLSGQVALITGAGRGIGAGIARVLAEAGADLAVNARTDQYLAPLAEEIAAVSGRRVMAIPADLTDSSEAERTVGQVIDDLGRIDILVNGVGDAIAKPLVPLPDRDLEAVSDGDLELTLGLNLTSAILCCRAVGPHMIERRSGVVVNIGSATGLRGGARLSLYTAGKAGMIGLTRALALEWAPYGIRVNSIAPGSFPDRVTTGDKDYEEIAARASRVPLGRVGDLREAGLLTLYLASPASAYMTGQTVYLDGGATL